MATNQESFHPKSFLHIILTIFIGLLLAGFVGLGVAAFYSEPRRPDYPNFPTPARIDSREIDSEYQQKVDAANTDYEQAQKEYDKKSANYNKIASSIILFCALIILGLSIFAGRKFELIADGLLLGGVFTLLYSIGRAMLSSDLKFQFLMMGIGLIAALFITYKKFGHNLSQPKP